MDRDVEESLASLSLSDGSFERFSLSNRGIVYNVLEIIGNGSFGVVYKALCENDGQIVAIKKVLQDPRYKNRELEVMLNLKHPNTVKLVNSFLSYHDDNKEKIYLYLILEYVPETIHWVIDHYTKSLKTQVPLIYTKLFIYQLARSLNYLHSFKYCHRDIKPQNLLVDREHGILKLADFGSAKQLLSGEKSIPYICSRYYRAPELIFGSKYYSPSIDIWSLGCVLGELLIGRVLFAGQSSVEQLVEIIQVLGTPSKPEINAMNSSYEYFEFPIVQKVSWEQVLKSAASPSAVDLMNKILTYNPATRLSPLEICAHSFFDQLRDESTRLPNGQPLPNLFDFTEKELAGASVELRRKLIPPHYTTTQTNP